ncbi:hypothetical protein [Symbiobacterium thermophilum]|uniref:Uncharacterized protein n=1 Tax=Symbiobacterium thermophilum TaxID=2734 RepID=A0A1Y2T7V9_SYMTR|nr:hypothetical protein [Symbiobacterium thermophilum]MBY6275598.1 hypothetical protein [Symbiobacterium thermophilum]OTA41876.1 MAG: hypothetical protein A6D92_03150 [Symbiobacterium thermophilum]
MSTLTQTEPLTAHELLLLNELIRLESGDVQKTKSMLAMVSDADLRQQLTGCLQTGQAHVRALHDFCRARGIGG